LYPLLWVVGIAIAFWPILFFLTIGKWKNCHPTFISNALLFVGILEVLSIPIGLFYFQVGIDRVLSALVNSLVWITSSFLVSYNLKNVQIRKLLKILINIALIQSVIVISAKILFPKIPPIPILHNTMKIFGTNSSAFANNEIIYIDWLNGFAFRTHGIMANATWAGGYSALAIILLLKYQPLNLKEILRNSIKYIALSYVVILSLSRSVLIALFLSIISGLIVNFLFSRGPAGRISVLIFGFVVGISVTIIVVSSGNLQAIFEGINQTRSGSLQTRSEIYQTTINLIQSHPLPLLGYGIKPSGEGLVASVATHSTPLGVLFKGGLLGLVAYVFFIFGAFKKLFDSKSSIGFSLFLFIMLWSLLEDFDGGHLIPLYLALVFRPEITSTFRDNYK
jgi:O-antigen ligase